MVGPFFRLYGRGKLEWGYRQIDRPRIEARPVKFAGPPMALRDHGAAVRLDARVEHGLCTPSRSAGMQTQLEPAVGNESGKRPDSRCCRIAARMTAEARKPLGGFAVSQRIPAGQSRCRSVPAASSTMLSRLGVIPAGAPP